MSQYTSYYLYQKYQKIGTGDWTPVTPSVFSVNGDGTMPLSAKTEYDPNCGYSPEAMYRWVNMDISTNWVCDDCPTPQYRTVSTAFTCVGYDKHYLNEYQVSYDSGVTWTTTSTTTGDLIEVNSEYCGYTPGPQPFNGKYQARYIGGSTYSAECDSNSALSLVKKTITINSQSYPMTDAVVGSCITSLIYGVFSACTSLSSVTIPDSVTIIDYRVFKGDISLTDVVIPSGVTSIGNEAFMGCRELPSISIPNSVTSIGYDAFNGCTAATSIVIGTGVTTIGHGAFAGCRNITSVVIPNSVTSMDYGVFINCSGLTSVNIPNSITSIGNRTFEGCRSLTSITIPNSVTSIGTTAFSGCSASTSIVIGTGVTEIGSAAFNRCSSLTSVSIPDSTTIIDNDAFYGCSGLTSVTIGSGITSISANAFNRCSGLTSITIYAIAPPSLGSYVFNNTNNCPIYVPASSVDTYKSASGWSTYASRITAIPNS